MTSRITAAAVTAALAVVLCCTATAQTEWFNRNFDTYNLGNIHNQDGWTGSAGPGHVRIVGNFSGAGRCIEMDAVEFNQGEGQVSHTVTSGAGGLHYVEFYAAMDTTLKPGESYANLCYIKFLSSAGAELTRFYFRGDVFNILQSGPQLILANANDRQWHKIGLTFHLLTNTLDVQVDDVPVVTSGALYNAGTDIGTIRIGQWSQTVYNKTECFVDNFVCSSLELTGIGKVALGPRFFPGWQVFNVCYPCVFLDSADSKYKMYYSGSTFGYMNESTWGQWTTGYVTSADEEKWLFPDSYEAVLNAHKFMEGDVVDAQTESAKFDSIFAYMPCVIKDGSTYKMWYAGWNGDFTQNPDHTANKINFRVGYATSPDGVTWTKYPNNDNPAPVLNLGACGEQDLKGVSHPWVLKKNGTFHMWYEGYDGAVWRIFHTTSTDGVNWQTPQLVLSPGTSGASDDRGVRNPVVVERSGGSYEMWYQGQCSTSPKYRVLRATSADGITWAKVAGVVALHPTAPSDRPSLNLSDPDAQVLVNSVIVNPDGTYTVYYARQLTETNSLRQGPVKYAYFYIFREVVDL